jgi:hypothetical protein
MNYKKKYLKYKKKYLNINNQYGGAEQFSVRQIDDMASSFIPDTFSIEQISEEDQERIKIIKNQDYDLDEKAVYLEALKRNMQNIKAKRIALEKKEINLRIQKLSKIYSKEQIQELIQNEIKIQNDQDLDEDDKAVNLELLKRKIEDKRRTRLYQELTTFKPESKKVKQFFEKKSTGHSPKLSSYSSEEIAQIEAKFEATKKKKKNDGVIMGHGLTIPDTLCIIPAGITIRPVTKCYTNASFNNYTDVGIITNLKVREEILLKKGVGVGLTQEEGNLLEHIRKQIETEDKKALDLRNIKNLAIAAKRSQTVDFPSGTDEIYSQEYKEGSIMPNMIIHFSPYYPSDSNVIKSSTFSLRGIITKSFDERFIHHSTHGKSEEDVKRESTQFHNKNIISVERMYQQQWLLSDLLNEIAKAKEKDTNLPDTYILTACRASDVTIKLDDCEDDIYKRIVRREMSLSQGEDVSLIGSFLERLDDFLRNKEAIKRDLIMYYTDVIIDEKSLDIYNEIKNEYIDGLPDIVFTNNLLAAYEIFSRIIQIDGRTPNQAKHLLKESQFWIKYYNDVAKPDIKEKLMAILKFNIGKYIDSMFTEIQKQRNIYTIRSDIYCSIVNYLNKINIIFLINLLENLKVKTIIEINIKKIKNEIINIEKIANLINYKLV